MKLVKIIFITISLLLFSAGCQKNAAPEAPKAASDAAGTSGAPIEDMEDTEDTELSAAETAIPETAEEADAAVTADEEGFWFVYNGEVIRMGDYIEGVVSKLGAASDYVESDSCTSEGMMKTYYYSGAEISAYAKTEGDEYRIFSIILTDDSISTAEGLYIGQTQDEMTAVYGTNYQSVPGVCQYTKNGTALTFDLEGEDIICITYTLLNI